MIALRHAIVFWEIVITVGATPGQCRETGSQRHIAAELFSHHSLNFGEVEASLVPNTLPESDIEHEHAAEQCLLHPISYSSGWLLSHDGSETD